MTEILTKPAPTPWNTSDSANDNYATYTLPNIQDNTTNFYANKLFTQISNVVPTAAKVVKNPYSSLETYTLAELIYNNINYDNNKLPLGTLPFNPTFGTTTIDVSGGRSFSAKDASVTRFEINSQGDTIIKPRDTTGLTINTVNSNNTDNTYLSLKNNSENEVFSISQDTGDRAKIVTNGPLLLTGSGSNIKIQFSGGTLPTFEVTNEGDTTIGRDTNIKGTLDVSGNTTLYSTLDVSGNSTFGGTATFNGDLTINSNILTIPSETYVSNSISSTEPSARIATQGDIQTSLLGLTMKEPVKVLFDFTGKSIDYLFGIDGNTDNGFSIFKESFIGNNDIVVACQNYNLRKVTDSSDGTIKEYDLSIETEEALTENRAYNKNNKGIYILGLKNVIVRASLNNSTITDDDSLSGYLPPGTRILLHTDFNYYNGIWIVTYVSDSSPLNAIEQSRTWLVRAPDYDDIGIDTTLSQNSYVFVKEGYSQGGYIILFETDGAIDSNPAEGGMLLSTFSITVVIPENLAYDENTFTQKVNTYKINQFSGFGEINITSEKTNTNEQSVTVSKVISNGKADYVIGLDLGDTLDTTNNANIEVLKDILKSYDQTFKTLFANLEIKNFEYNGIYTDTSPSADNNTDSI